MGFIPNTFLFSIVTEYPLWFILFCILAGAGYSFLLYFKNKQHKELSKKLVYLLSALRFLAVFIICFLLLSPLVKSKLKQVEKPILVIAQDNSESLQQQHDSNFLKQQLPAEFDKFSEGLIDKFDIQYFTYGQNVSEGKNINYTEKQTDISELVAEISNRYANRNLGAVIVSGDGIFNRGSNPVFEAEKLKTPFYTIALGDTIPKKDALIKDVLHNKIAFLNNTFPLEIKIEARDLKGKKSKLTVLKKGKTLYSQEINYSSNFFETIVPLQLEASEKGVQRYSINITAVDGEITTKNNSRDVIVDVLDSRQKVLILADAPHPDINALKSALDDNQNYETEFFITERFNKKVSAYNLVVLAQLPSNFANPIKIVQEIKQSNIPVLFLIGNQSNLSALSNLGFGLEAQLKNAKPNEVIPVSENMFSLFSMSDMARNAITNYSPLSVPYANFKFANGFQTLLSQQLGAVKTKEPLVVVGENNNQKLAYVLGEGFWKWRLIDFSKNKNHNQFNELVTKIVQYLSVKENKSLFRVTTKNAYLDNEAIAIEAELYNESYELINDAEVSLTLIDENDKKYSFNFSPANNRYKLNAGVFAAGTYKYEAKANYKGKSYTARGEIIVNKIVAELLNTTADHQLLNLLATKTGGKMYFINQLQKLSDELNSRDDLVAVGYEESKLSDAINLKWIFILILVLLTTEWFLRKYNGNY
ncbi:MAG: hypothetical protein V4667_11520 [Bacteroidota bacterium]